MIQQLGIETFYRGTLFRSRAEARWAAFFDRCQWPWRYEPVDLDGYIPDFVLSFERPVLVEVKGGVVHHKGLTHFIEKAQQPAWIGEVVIVGAHPMWNEPDMLNPPLGIMAERAFGPGGFPEWEWDTCCVHRCVICARVSFHPEDGHWRCRVCGAYEGNRYIGGVRSGELDELWASACNLTQWRPSALAAEE